MRMTASYRKASGCIQRRKRQQEERRNTRFWQLGAHSDETAQKTIRGSGSPPSPHGFCTGKKQFEQKPEALTNRMVYLLVRIYGLGLETADLLVHELLSRTLRDRKAVARYAGLTGSPD